MLLEEWGGLLLLDQTIQNGKVWKRRLQRASRLQINPLTALVAGAKNSLSLAKRLQLPERQQQLLAEKLELEIFLSSIILEKKYLAWSPSRWCRELENGPWSPGAIAVYICEGGILWRPLIRWWGRWRQIKSPITPKELIQEGWQPGPELGAELTRLRKEILDQQTLPR